MDNNPEEMVTKKDLHLAIANLKKYIEGEISAFRDEMVANMYTKQDHALDQIWMDKAMTEIEAAREERLLYSRQVLRIDDKVFDHEKMIRALENG